MAPIKFEEELRDKIEGRQLQPSVNAWQKLSDRLDHEPETGRRRPYWWLGIAASFVIGIMITTIIFSKDPGGNLHPETIVTQENQEVIDNQELDINIDTDEKTSDIQHIALEEPELKESQSSEKSMNSISQNTTTMHIEKVVAADSMLKIDSTETLAQEEVSNANPIEILKKSPEDLKIDEVVAQIQKLQETKSRVSDAEIDALLKQAQEELMAQRLYDTSSKTVNAELLLLQVETDLEQSFRDRVFEALKSGYSKVRTAVADRNQ